MSLHVYESHLGGYFTTKDIMTFEEQCCEQCGDSDWYLGEVDTEREAEELYKVHIGHNYDLD